MNKRIFLAVEVSEEWKAVINQFIEANKLLNYKWIPEANWHFTLLFIGHFPADKLQSIYTLLEKCFGEIPAFEIEFESFMYFPPNRPRMIWCKGKQSAEFASAEKAAYTTLKYFCEEDNMEFHAKLSKKSIPHITLSRLKHLQKPLAELVLPLIKLPPVKVNKIILLESLLKSTGSEYIKLAEFDLKTSESADIV
ncbi:MAG: RNA 2',3'-cyclic phosphodiesterase [Bacteroidia bacterium]